MKHYLRICAEINLNAVAYNFKSMKDRLTPETKMIAVVKTVDTDMEQFLLRIWFRNIRMSGGLRWRLSKKRCC